MAKVDSTVHAPEVPSYVLWNMTDEQFNDWRREHDYPRIISFLQTKLPEFNEWMKDQDLSIALMLKYSPSRFLKEESYIYIYDVLHDNIKEDEILSIKKYEVNETFFHKNLVRTRKDIIPYPNWYEIRNKKKAPSISVNSWQGRSHRVLSDLELIDLGHHRVRSRWPLGKRLLDFTNISDLQIHNCLNNATLNLWFCSAHNLSIDGDFAFVDAYNSKFSQAFQAKYNNLKLSNGTFQTWTFNNCDVNLAATNAVLHLWDVKGRDFNASISNTDIRNCKFKALEIHRPFEYVFIRDFHAHIKRLYSQIGKKKEASEHYYLEKTFERKSFLHVKENYRELHHNAKGKWGKRLLKAKYSLRYCYSWFLNALWGYGERPGRVFTISIATILIFTLLYYFLPGSDAKTHYNFINSFYFSIVTFTTLGYGDISQSTPLLKMLSGLEALSGLSFWGILIAGFTNNSKDY